MSKAPKLRFKEFSGDWEEKRFKDIYSVKSGYGFKLSEYSSTGIPLIKIDNIGYGKIKWDNISYLPEEYKESYSDIVLEKDDILLALNRPITNNKLKIAMLKETDIPAILYQRVGKIIVDKTFNKLFSYYLLNNVVFDFVLKESKGSDQPFISTEELKKVKFNIPLIEEQEKIASFLSLIDDKISLQGEKVEALKDYKRGMMQKIFSRELRFKDDEGRDYPEWEERKIKDIFIVTRGVVIAKTEISESKDDKNKYPVYSSQTTNNGILGYDSSYDFEGDYLTWTTDGANAGKVFRRNGKFRCTNVCGVLVEKQETLGFANKMISEILNKETPKHVSYVGNPKLMNGVMGDIKIKVPILDEQIKISKVLDNIDLKIEKEQEKLDCLNEYKKGLLQQMFV